MTTITTGVDPPFELYGFNIVSVTSNEAGTKFTATTDLGTTLPITKTEYERILA